MYESTETLNEFTHKVIRSLGIRAKKSLGQNFLISDKVRNRILSLIDPNENKQIIEIGGGLGALTFPIAQQYPEFVVYEIDDKLRNWLSENLKNISIKITVAEDFLNEYPPDNISDREFIVIGNIPYNLTSPILQKIYDLDSLPFETILMVQNDVAQRINAKPGIKARGRLTIWCEYHAIITNEFDVRPGSFFPQPKVGSSVIRLITKDKFPLNKTQKESFFEFVKRAFSTKRKTLVNNLIDLENEFSKKDLEKIIVDAGLDPRIRAEGLTVDDFLSIYQAIFS